MNRLKAFRHLLFSELSKQSVKLAHYLQFEENQEQVTLTLQRPDTKPQTLVVPLSSFHFYSQGRPDSNDLEDFNYHSNKKEIKKIMGRLLELYHAG